MTSSEMSDESVDSAVSTVDADTLDRTPDFTPPSELDVEEQEVLKEHVERIVALAAEDEWFPAAVEAQRIQVACQRVAHLESTADSSDETTTPST